MGNVEPLAKTRSNKKAQRRAQAQNRQKNEEEDERTCTAIHELERSLEEFRKKNDLIAGDLKCFVHDLTHETTWLSSTEEWEREDKEWEQGETATLRDNLKEASERRNFCNSTFVQQFLQQRGMSLERMSDIEIDYYLHKKLLEIEVEQSKKVRRRYERIKNHDKSVRDLLKDIELSEKLITRRITTYEEIVEGLKRLGVDRTKLDVLQEQVGKVKTTLQEYTKVKKDCVNVQKEGQRRLQEKRRQVERLHEQFGEFTSNVTSTEREARRNLEGTESVLKLMLFAVVTGAVIGTAIVPTVIGTILGGFVGGAGGLVYGLWTDKEQLQAELQESKETSQRLVQSCREILARVNEKDDEV